MAKASQGARRDAFLWKAVEQFEGLSRWIVAPFEAETWQGNGEAVFAVSQKGQAGELLRVVARFDDAAAERAGFKEMVMLLVEWQGEVTEMLTLGWTGTVPDIERGLDSRADHAEGEYPMGRVIRALRDDLAVALHLRASGVERLLGADGCNDLQPTQQTRDHDEPGVPEAWKPAASEVEQRAAPGPADIGLLQVSLGELAGLGGLKADQVFAGFIKAATSGSALAQGAVTAFLQGALLELYVFQKACVEGPSWMRPKSPRAQGGALRDAVLTLKAVLFEGNDEVRRQVAREMVTTMRVYYEQALTCAGLPKEETATLARSAFGNAGVIVNEAVKGLGASLSFSRGRFGRRLLAGKGLE